MSWSMVALGEVASPIETWNPQRSLHASAFDYIDLSSICRESKVVRSPVRTEPAEAPSRARQKVRANDILISTVRPNLNGVAVVEDELDGATASTGFTVVRADHQKASPRYLFHWATSPSFVAEMVRKATGQSYPAVSDRIVMASKIPLPPLPEQRRIAGILDAADALRRRRRRAIETLDTLQGALFAEMFGDELWMPSTPLSDLTERITVGVVVRPASYYVAEGVPALRSVNVEEGNFLLSDLKYFPPSISLGKLRKSQLKTNDVVVVRTGQPGRSAVVPRSLAGANCIDMLIVSPSSDRLDSLFFESLMNSARGRTMVLSQQRGQIQQHLNATALKDFSFSPPTLFEQKQFTDRLKSVLARRTAMTTHLAHLDTLFAALQSRAFAGDL